jgi:hypothetical protein
MRFCAPASAHKNEANVAASSLKIARNTVNVGFKDGVCVKTEQGCREFINACKAFLKCSFKDGECVATEQRCKASSLCKVYGKCGVRNGARRRNKAVEKLKTLVIEKACAALKMASVYGQSRAARHRGRARTTVNVISKTIRACLPYTAVEHLKFIAELMANTALKTAHARLPHKAVENLKRPVKE